MNRRHMSGPSASSPVRAVLRLVATVGAILATCGSAQAADLLSQVVLVKDAVGAATPLPLDSNQQSGVTFTVTAAQAGTYVIAVADQSQHPLSALNVSVATATQSIAQITGALGGSTSRTVTLAAGTYTVQPLATGGTITSGGQPVPQPGAVLVTVTPQGGSTPFWQDQWVVNASNASVTVGQSILSQEFTVSTGGSFTISLTDQQFPAALSSLELIIFPHDTTTPVTGTPRTAGSASVNLSAGAYDLFVYAQANTGSGVETGLYSVSIAMGSTVAFAATEPVGQLPAPTTFAVPTSAAVSLTVNDLQFPAPLASGAKFVAIEGATVLQPSFAPGTPYSLAATAGTVQVFAAAQPDPTGGQGAYAVYATQAGSTLADVAIPVVDSSHYGSVYVPSSPLAAGSYQLGVNDYGRPDPLGGLYAGVVQQGHVISNSETQSTSGTTTFPADAGKASILVFPQLAASGDDSLLGVVLSATTSGSVQFTTTNGIGALFTSIPVTIPTSGNYTLKAVDLGFPATMSNLQVIVTTGQTVAGSVYGAGTISFAANTSGPFVVNVLAQVASAQHYGEYGVEVSPAATATLTANPTTITSGQTATLTWNATNVTSCIPGSGWTTSQATSGSQVTAALTANTSFSITCSGDGGSATATALVEVNQPAAKSGGGALSPDELLVLAAVWLYGLRRRRAAA